jgi:RPA family protein
MAVLLSFDFHYHYLTVLAEHGTLRQTCTMDKIKRARTQVPACRVFFAEFLHSDLFIEEAGVTTLITPTGARCQRHYAVGAVEAVETRGNVVRIQLNDTTASIPVFAPQDRYPAERVKEQAGVEQYLAVIGTVHARTGADGSKRALILAKALGIVEERARAAWLLTTAMRTIERIEQLRIFSGEPNSRSGMSSGRVREHYALDNEHLDALAGTAINAVNGLLTHYRAQTRALIMEQITTAGKSRLDRSRLLDRLRRGQGLPETWVGEIIDGLILEGQCSESESGVLQCARR